MTRTVAFTGRFRLQARVKTMSDHLQTESYITTCGHLLLLNLGGSLFSLDTSHLIERLDGNKQVMEPSRVVDAEH